MVGPIIKINNLSFFYPNNKKVLNSINLTIYEKDFVGIMGPSPSGKSTLAYCITGLIPNYIKGEMIGDVIVDGINTKDTTLSELSTHVGLVLQDPEAQLLELRVIDEIALPLENLGLPRDEIRKRVEEVMKLVGIDKYREKSPMDLSGGEKQKVAIASVLALKPRVLVLDEPTSNIDVKSTIQVYETLKKLNQELGLTIVIIENKLEFISKYANRIILMKNGEIIVDDIPEEILKKRELLENLDIDVPNKSNLNEIYLKKRGESKIKQNCNDTIIKFVNVSYKYPDGTLALNNINLTIRKGEILFIMGENGSGKSTLAKHMNGLLKPTQGKVIVDKYDTRKYPTYKLSRIVGLVFQNPSHQIVGESVYDEIAIGLRNIGLSSSEVDKEVRKIAKIFNLLDKLDMIPEELSTGELKRLMVASVVAMKPKVIVLDEPMTGMTRIHSRRILNSILKIMGNDKTIIAITHDPLLALEYADRVVIMSNGKIVYDGNSIGILRYPLFSEMLKVEVGDYV